jgi:hypothetical protein
MCSNTFRQTQESGASGQVRECGAARFANESMQIGPIAIPLLQPFDAGGIHIDREDCFAIEQHPGEIADAAAYLNHALSQLRRNQPALPGEIVRGMRHAFLICYGVDRRMHSLLF